VVQLIDPSGVFEEIYTIVKNSVEYDVFVAEIPEDDSLKYFDNGLMKPFTVLYFGGPIRASKDHHLNDSSRDTTIIYVTVECYAARAFDAIKSKGHIIDVLTHSKGDDFTQPILSGSMSYSRSSNTIRPTQYVESFSVISYSNLSS